MTTEPKTRKPPAESAVVKPARLMIVAPGAMMQFCSGAAEVDLHSGQVRLIDRLAAAWAVAQWDQIEHANAGTDRQVLSVASVIEMAAGAARAYSVLITLRAETLAEAGHRRLSEAPKITFPWRCDLPAGQS